MVQGLTRLLASTQKEEGASELGREQCKESSVEPLRVLHLSDLHIEAGSDASALLQPRTADLRDREDGLGVTQSDYLVVSGDLTNRATPKENPGTADPPPPGCVAEIEAAVVASLTKHPRVTAALAQQLKVAAPASVDAVTRALVHEVRRAPCWRPYSICAPLASTTRSR